MDSIYYVYVINRGWITKSAMSSEPTGATEFTHEQAIARCVRFRDISGNLGAIPVAASDLISIRDFK